MEGEEEEEAGKKEINDKAVSFALSGLPCYREKKEGERICGWKEQWRKRWRETQKHSLGADQVQLLIGVNVCECVHVLWALAMVAAIASTIRDACCCNVL